MVSVSIVGFNYLNFHLQPLEIQFIAKPLAHFGMKKYGTLYSSGSTSHLAAMGGFCETPRNCPPIRGAGIELSEMTEG